jgi:hypothetical protein
LIEEISKEIEQEEVVDEEFKNTDYWFDDTVEVKRDTIKFNYS